MSFAEQLLLEVVHTAAPNGDVLLVVINHLFTHAFFIHNRLPSDCFQDGAWIQLVRPPAGEILLFDRNEVNNI